MPNNIKKISYSCFANCTKLKKINIPDTVTKIDDSAFGKCYSLKSVTIPNSIKNIGKNVFENCYDLKLTIVDNSKVIKYAKKNDIDYVEMKKTSIDKLTKGRKSITVKWKKQTKQTKGYEIQIATNSKFTKNLKTIIVSKNKTTSKTIKKLKANKKYYVRIRTYNKFNGTKYYSTWSKVKNIKTK